MLQRGNAKLGSRIWVWNLPVVKTCPGASPLCLSLCYARRGRHVFNNVKRAHARNQRLARGADFVGWMTTSLRMNCVDVLRIHASGDFYSNDYIQSWIQIVRRNRAVKFFAYTRSWRVPDLQRSLQKFSREKNVELWLSSDHSMPRPPRWKHCRTCYLMTDDNDQPRYQTDLVFRDQDRTVLKRTANGSLVCPFENGVTRVDCSHCKLCWKTLRAPLPAARRDDYAKGP